MVLSVLYYTKLKPGGVYCLVWCAVRQTTKKAPVDLRPVSESLGSELSIAEEFCGWSMKRKKSYAHSTPGGPGG